MIELFRRYWGGYCIGRYRVKVSALMSVLVWPRSRPVSHTESGVGIAFASCI